MSAAVHVLAPLPTSPHAQPSTRRSSTIFIAYLHQHTIYHRITPRKDDHHHPHYKFFHVVFAIYYIATERVTYRVERDILKEALRTLLIGVRIVQRCTRIELYSALAH